MSDLLQTYTFLNQAMQADDVLCLIQAVCWLNPLWIDEDDFEPDPDVTLKDALIVTRRAFPDVYLDAVTLLRQGVPDKDVDRLICEGISEEGIPIDELEYMYYGIQLPAYGVDLINPDFYDNHNNVLPVMELFGISPEMPDGHYIDVPSIAYKAGGIISDDLKEHPEKRYQQVAHALDWLFSRSGNSIVDWDYETMCEIEPLSWDANDIDFAREIIREADEIMDEVFAGLKWLESQPVVMQALQDNIQKVYKALNKKGNNDDTPNVRFEWPRIGEGVERAA